LASTFDAPDPEIHREVGREKGRAGLPRDSDRSAVHREAMQPRFASR
jgi:hypothetical protein